MDCPNCKTPYQCSCKSCVKRNPNKVPWNRTQNENSYDETCPGCGLTKDTNDWMDEEYRQYKEKEN